MLTRLVILATLLATPALAEGWPKTPLTVNVAAAKDATWDIDCRFPLVKLDGVHVNTWTHSGRGPLAHAVPAVSVRCVLTKRDGAGPVSVRVLKDTVRMATAKKAGEQVRLLVW